MRRGALLLAALVFAWAAPAAARETEAAFTQRMAERFRAAMPGYQVRITAPLEMEMTRPGQTEPAQVFVGRIWNYCQSASAEDCEASVARFVGVLRSSSAETTAPVTRAQLRVVVRHPDYCASLARLTQDRPSEDHFLYRPFAPDLCEAVVVDYPDRMATLTSGEMERLGLGADEAWALAERQTISHLPEPLNLEGLAQGQLVALAGFDYIPSMLINREGWRAAAAAGPLVAAIPSDGLMVVVREATITDMAGFRQTTRQAFQEAERQISDQIYRWTDAGWVIVAE